MKVGEFEINIEIRDVKAKGSFENYGLYLDDVGTATFVSVSAGSAAAVEFKKQNPPINVEDGLMLLRVDGEDVTAGLTAAAAALPDVQQEPAAKILNLVCLKDPETYAKRETHATLMHRLSTATTDVAVQLAQGKIEDRLKKLVGGENAVKNHHCLQQAAALSEELRNFQLDRVGSELTASSPNPHHALLNKLNFATKGPDGIADSSAVQDAENEIKAEIKRLRTATHVAKKKLTPSELVRRAQLAMSLTDSFYKDRLRQKRANLHAQLAADTEQTKPYRSMLKRFNNATSKVERSSAEASIEAEIKKLKADAEVAKEIENGLSASEIKKINPDSRASSKLMLALELSTDFHKVQLRLKSTRLDSAQAQTMKNMITHVDTNKGEKKLLYLTNPQANALAEDWEINGMGRLLNAFGIEDATGSPGTKLVIRLQLSHGSLQWYADTMGGWSTETDDFKRAELDKNPMMHGIYSPPPYVDGEQGARAAEQTLVDWFAAELIPLAVEQHALVMMSCRASCFVGGCFSKAIEKARGGFPLGKLPFATLAYGSARHVASSDAYYRDDQIVSASTLAAREEPSASAEPAVDDENDPDCAVLPLKECNVDTHNLLTDLQFWRSIAGESIELDSVKHKHKGWQSPQLRKGRRLKSIGISADGINLEMATLPVAKFFKKPFDIGNNDQLVGLDINALRAHLFVPFHQKVPGEKLHIVFEPKKEGKWSVLCRACRPWQRRRKVLNAHTPKDQPNTVTVENDVAWDVDNFIIFEACNAEDFNEDEPYEPGKNEAPEDNGPMTRMIRAVFAWFRAQVPCVTIKTGLGDRNGGPHSLNSLKAAVDVMIGGSPLIFIDLRDRDLQLHKPFPLKAPRFPRQCKGRPVDIVLSRLTDSTVDPESSVEVFKSFNNVAVINRRFRGLKWPDGGGGTNAAKVRKFFEQIHGLERQASVGIAGWRGSRKRRRKVLKMVMTQFRLKAPNGLGDKVADAGHHHTTTTLHAFEEKAMAAAEVMDRAAAEVMDSEGTGPARRHSTGEVSLASLPALEDVEWPTSGTTNIDNVNRFFDAMLASMSQGDDAAVDLDGRPAQELERAKRQLQLKAPVALIPADGGDDPFPELATIAALRDAAIAGAEKMDEWSLSNLEDAYTEGVEELDDGEKIRHPYTVYGLGLTTEPEPEWGRCTVVSEVRPGSAACKAGILAGDILLKVGTTELASMDHEYVSETLEKAAMEAVKKNLAAAIKMYDPALVDGDQSMDQRVDFIDGGVPDRPQGWFQGVAAPLANTVRNISEKLNPTTSQIVQLTICKPAEYNSPATKKSELPEEDTISSKLTEQMQRARKAPFAAFKSATLKRFVEKFDDDCDNLMQRTDIRRILHPVLRSACHSIDVVPSNARQTVHGDTLPFVFMAQHGLQPLTEFPPPPRDTGIIHNSSETVQPGKSSLPNGPPDIRLLRFVATRTRDPNSSAVELQQVRFFDDRGGAVAAHSVANPGGGNPRGKGPENAGLSDASTWLDRRKKPIEFYFSATARLDTFVLVSSNATGGPQSHAGREPLSGRMDVMNAEGNWQTAWDGEKSTYPQLAWNPRDANGTITQRIKMHGIYPNNRSALRIVPTATFSGVESDPEEFDPERVRFYSRSHTVIARAPGVAVSIPDCANLEGKRSTIEYTVYSALSDIVGFTYLGHVGGQRSPRVSVAEMQSKRASQESRLKRHSKSCKRPNRSVTEGDRQSGDSDMSIFKSSLHQDVVAEHGAEHVDGNAGAVHAAHRRASDGSLHLAREGNQDDGDGDGDGDVVGQRLVGYRFDANVDGDWNPWDRPNLATTKTSKELAPATPTPIPKFHKASFPRNPLRFAPVAEVFEFMVIAHIHTVVSTIFNYDTHDTGDARASESLERTIKRRTLLENAGRAVSCDQGELTKGKMTDMLVEFCFNRLFADWFELKGNVGQETGGATAGDGRYGDAIVQMKSNARQVLESSTFYGIGLSDSRPPVGAVTDLRKIVGSASRTPDQESLEALKMLAEAWTIVDVCHLQASRYKFLAKVTFVMQLILGIAAVVLSSLSLEEGDASVERRYQAAILTVSVVATFITGIAAFYNPQSRWKELRCVAASLQSIIYHFRTRTGAFAGWKANDSSSVRALCEKIVEMQEALFVQGDLAQDTIAVSLSGQPTPRHWKRLWRLVDNTIGRLGRGLTRAWVAVAGPFGFGTWRDAHVPDGHRKVVNGWPHLEAAEIKRRNNIITRKERKKKSLRTELPNNVDIKDLDLDVEKLAEQLKPPPAWDDCHSPLKPGHYIQARLNPMMVFYERRQVVVYNRQSRIRWFTLLMAATCTILAFYAKFQYVAALTVLASAAVSWAEYNQLQDKVSRYNHTIIAINELIVWWSSLNEVDQSGAANLDRLITEGERAINAELITWRAAVTAKGEPAKAESDTQPEPTATSPAEDTDGLRQRNKKQEA